MCLTNIIIILFICYFSTTFGLYALGMRPRFLLEELNSTPLCPHIRKHTIEQPLDHFDENEKRTWHMLYYERLDLWREGGPIYLFIGGEGSVSPRFLEKGLMFDLAEETNGAMLLSEHRYYGDPKPLPEINIKNLVYLSSRQALADLAQLLKEKKSLSQFKESKVVVVGGSYPGNLATWMRLLYPELVDAAIASSAPVLAKADFYEYLETVADDFKLYGGLECYDKIAAKYNRYDQLLQTNAGIEQIKEEENICASTDMTKEENKQTFFLLNTERFMEIAQYGEPKNISTTCEDLSMDYYSSGLGRFSLFNVKSWYEGNQCHDYDFSSIFTSLPDDSMVLWLYQTCTEFGYYQDTSSDNQPFTKNIPIEFYFRICSTLFGAEFNEESVYEGIRNTNLMYGGLQPNVTKVVFINGDMDPWHRLGIIEDLSNEAPAVLVHGTSHCADLFQHEGDPEQLIETRNYVKKLIKNWIGVTES